MSMGSAIMEIITKFNSSELERGIHRSKELLKDLAREKLTEIGVPSQLLDKAAVLGPYAMAAGAGAGVAIAMKEAVETASELGEQMQLIHLRTGISVSSIYDMRHALREAGMEVSDLNMAMMRMQRSLSTAFQTGIGGSVLTQMGLDPEQLKKANPEEQFRMIGKAIAALKNPMDQTRVAMEFFGRSGARMLPLFKSEEFQEGGEHHSEAGKLLEENAVQLKEHAENSKYLISQIWDDMSIGFATQILPQLIMFENAIKRIQQSSAFTFTGKAIGELTAFAMNPAGETARGLGYAFGLGKGKDGKTPKTEGGGAEGENGADSIFGQHFAIYADELAKIGGGGNYITTASAISPEGQKTHELLREVRDAIKEKKATSDNTFRSGKTQWSETAQFA